MGESFMNARLVALLLSAASLVGCSNSQAVPVPPAQSALPPAQRVAPDAGCEGSGGVKVRPCPVTLTKQKSTDIVTVTGPKVDDSAVVETACEKKGVCTVGQFSSEPVKWYVYAGTKCASAVIYFYGYSASKTVGVGHLKVINKDC
jgi:hypothetical protein